MQILDDQVRIKEIDSQNMYQLIKNFPLQMREGVEIAQKIKLPKFEKIKNIVVAGLGGSAIGGDLVRSYLNDEIKIPFIICRNYTLPEFVDSSTLVFVSSYSGNTEETLSAYNEAKKRKAQIIAVTSGGKLLELVKKDKFPFMVIPTGYPPRAALGFSFVPILLCLEKLGLIKEKEKELNKSIDFLLTNVSNFEMGKPLERNEAKKLAIKLFGKLPLIYASSDHFDAVANRWKGQICENAKMLAFFNLFPEFNHNELVGWKILSDYKESLIVLMLKDQTDHPRIKRRMEIVQDIIEDLEIEVLEIESQGETLLSRIFSLIQLGDWASFYLAILNRENPTPVKVIDYLKNELAKE